ncbi:hypothetical protein C8Q76DRAFT_793569 [Earliella scabrosa]|nr:hypothetical protein C8Q76DRAFT_793569 [Earliella scabrosa]
MRAHKRVLLLLVLPELFDDLREGARRSAVGQQAKNTACRLQEVPLVAAVGSVNRDVISLFCGCDGAQRLAEPPNDIFLTLYLISLDFVKLQGVMGQNWLLTPIPFPKEVDEVLTKGRVAMQPGPLGSLSAELLRLLFDELHEFRDIVLFAITCKMLLAAGVPRLTRAYQEEFAPWVNCRLVCLGDRAQQEGVLAFPSLTDEEKDELKARAAAAKDPKQYDYTSALYIIANDTYHSQHETDKARRAIRTLYGRRWKDAQERELISKLLPDHVLRRVKRSSAGTEVLCNLSKGEYVRAEGLTLPGDCYARRVEDSQTLLTLALMSQICWSDDISISMPINEDAAQRIIRGPWVGDRFVITTLEDMPDKYRRIDWKDVTERVAAFLVKLNDDRLRYLVRMMRAQVMDPTVQIRRGGF